MAKFIIDNFIPESGHHCITNSLKQIFGHSGIRISEEMLFGLASGMSFIYFEFKESPFPIVGGRIKTGDFEDNLAGALNIKIKQNETKSAKKAYSSAIKMLSENKPVMIYADMAYLSYLNLPPDYHFGGHSVVLFGIDEEEQLAYISDRDGKNFKVTLNPDESPADYHLISLSDLEAARNSKFKPFPPSNRWLDFDFGDFLTVSEQAVGLAIKKNVNKFLNPPIRNVGLSGIRLFSEKIKTWKNMDDATLKGACINAFVMINKVGGTGGGCFRRMYGNFLIEAADLCKDEFFKTAGEEYIKISEEWDKIASKLYQVFDNLNRDILDDCSKDIFYIFIKEQELMNRLHEHLS